MIVLTGKYNDARVMTDNIDATTREQIQGFLGHPAFADTKPVVMPDCHAGAGAVIGYTAPMNDFIIPNLVGVDIGCGVYAYKLEGVTTIDSAEFAALDEFIREHIPSGRLKHDKPVDLDHLLPRWYYLELVVKVEKVARRTGQTFGDVLRSWRTLGGGNHFFEIDVDPDGNYWLLIHSGSRNFGYRVAQFYQEKARDQRPGFKDLEYLDANSDDGIAYFEDMKVAQEYAHANREFMAACIIEDFFRTFMGESVKTVHNYIGPDGIIRKGAISAYKGERVVIPLNMRDGTIFATGKGNADWNYSAPHGAGRILSRRKAKETLSLEEFRETMADAGVHSSCIGQAILDEAPGAYKDGAEIMALIGDTVVVDFVARPVYNFKAS